MLYYIHIFKVTASFKITRRRKIRIITDFSVKDSPSLSETRLNSSIMANNTFDLIEKCDKLRKKSFAFHFSRHVIVNCGLFFYLYISWGLPRLFNHFFKYIFVLNIFLAANRIRNGLHRY